MKKARSEPAVAPGLTLDSIKRTKARRKLSEFSRQAWPVLEPGTVLDWSWHLDAICDHIQAVLEDWIAKKRNPDFPQRCQNLLINIPPGTGKSRFVSVFAPAWMWLHWPEWRAIFLSANPRVALRDAMFARQLITSDWYLGFGQSWRLSEDQNAKGLYYNTEGGFRASFGITSAITGDRADALFVDDPHDAKGVLSEASRTDVLERWDSAIRNRVNDLRVSVRIGIMQRLHWEDWSGHILKKGGWEHLCIPMEFEARRPCKCPTCQRGGVTFLGWKDPRTADGQLLDPIRFTPTVIANEKKELGDYRYAGQHQQRPSPADGGIFKRSWWKYWVTLPFQPDSWLLSGDLAFAKSEGSSRVALQVWARKGANRYLVEQVCTRLDFVETKAALRELCTRYPQLGRKIIENKANGPAILAELRDEIAGLIAENVEGDKIARAIANTPEIQSGNVFLPAYLFTDGSLIPGREWVPGFIEEHAQAGPNSSQMDQVDATSQALKWLKIEGAYEAGDWADSKAK